MSSGFNNSATGFPSIFSTDSRVQEDSNFRSSRLDKAVDLLRMVDLTEIHLKQYISSHELPHYF